MSKNSLSTIKRLPKRKPIRVIEKELAKTGNMRGVVRKNLMGAYTRQIEQEQRVAQKICDRLNINLPTLEEMQKQIESRKDPSKAEINLFILLTNIRQTKQKIKQLNTQK